MKKAENNLTNFGVLLGVDYMRIEKMVLPENVGTLEALYNAIGCDMIEVVNPKGLPQPYVMVVDEEGTMKERPALNVIASYLYGMHEHGAPIVGNAVIMKEVMTPDGVDLAWLTGEEEIALERKLSNIWPAAVIEISSYLDKAEE